ncbi:MAG TPA: site-specific DNA-methyltransferase, partial [Anaerolineaceae bacterium]|nr:site-specific DNA-methyltransferase [Anaerolineaceae bacterium]
MIYHETPSGTLHQGEVLDILRTLPDESVNCCVTSPPYWGLRDYGTAEWEGGSAECDHVERVASTTYKASKEKQQEMATKQFGGQYKDTCAKCGAIRKDQQLGLEKTPEEYVARMVEIFREVRRVLKNDGVLWLNLGDSYASNGCYLHSWMEKHPEKKHLHTENAEKYKDTPAFRGGEYRIKAKDLVGIPWRVAFALQADGWYLRQDIIWHKPNPMPESVTDRCTKAHEYVFLMSKSARYYYDNEAIREDIKIKSNKELGGVGNYSNGIRNNNNFREYDKIKGANKRSVWTVTTKPFKGAHFATFPRDLIRPMIQAGCPEQGIVLDPFMGSGTTAIEAIYQ